VGVQRKHDQQSRECNNASALCFYQKTTNIFNMRDDSLVVQLQLKFIRNQIERVVYPTNTMAMCRLNPDAPRRKTMLHLKLPCDMKN
jgi:hypothetical protein